MEKAVHNIPHQAYYTSMHEKIPAKDTYIKKLHEVTMKIIKIYILVEAYYVPVHKNTPGKDIDINTLV